MTETQLELIEGEDGGPEGKLDPDLLLSLAVERWNPVKTYCLFSGGGDSSVVAHRCRDAYDALVFIDTGTAVPGVVEFVQSFAAWIKKPLIIESAGTAYRDMVLGGRPMPKKGGVEPPNGFPGKGMHNKAYSRLKERQIRKVLKAAKEGHPRSASVLFISGVRRAESQRRAKREPLTEEGSSKFVNPLIDWSNEEMRDYRRDHKLPESEVTALLHRSGECNCGAFAKAEEERAMMKSLWPEWFARNIEALEAECEEKGIRWCRWGGYDKDGLQAAGSGEAPGLLCSDCVQQGVLFND